MRVTAPASLIELFTSLRSQGHASRVPPKERHAELDSTPIASRLTARWDMPTTGRPADALERATLTNIRRRRGSAIGASLWPFLEFRFQSFLNPI